MPKTTLIALLASILAGAAGAAPAGSRKVAADAGLRVVLPGSFAPGVRTGPASRSIGLSRTGWTLSPLIRLDARSVAGPVASAAPFAPGLSAGNPLLVPSLQRLSRGLAQDGANAGSALNGAFDNEKDRDHGSFGGLNSCHSCHAQPDDDFPGDGKGNPVIVPEKLKPLLPSAQNEEHWTREITLHLHSEFSDGTMPPEALMDLAHQKGVRVLALSDHDTIAGVERAWKRAKELGMEFHPGAELTARGGVHVGAIDIDIYNPKLVAFVERVRAMRLKRAAAIIEHLNGLDELKSRGITLTVAEVVAKSKHEEGGTIELPHIARVLMDHGLIKSVDEAFDKYLKGDIAGDSGAGPDPTVDEVLEVIHAAGGKAVLNHPYTVSGKDDAHKDKRVEEILDKGIDAIEIYRPSHATSDNGRRRQDERAAKYLLWADARNLSAAPGADFHGTDTHLDQLAVWMPKNLAAQLLERLKGANAKALASLEKHDKGAREPGTPALLSVAAPVALGSLDWPASAWLIAIGLAGLVYYAVRTLFSPEFEERMRRSKIDAGPLYLGTWMFLGALALGLLLAL